MWSAVPPYFWDSSPSQYYQRSSSQRCSTTLHTSFPQVRGAFCRAADLSYQYRMIPDYWKFPVPSRYRFWGSILRLRWRASWRTLTVWWLLRRRWLCNFVAAWTWWTMRVLCGREEIFFWWSCCPIQDDVCSILLSSFWGSCSRALAARSTSGSSGPRRSRLRNLRNFGRAACSRNPREEGEGDRMNLGRWRAGFPSIKSLMIIKSVGLVKSKKSW